MKNRQRKMAVLLCVTLSALAFGGCGQTVVETTAEDVAVVKTANTEVGDLKLSANFIATINPATTSSFRNAANGRIYRIGQKRQSQIRQILSRIHRYAGTLLYRAKT